jgi:hypothetical protein
LEQQMIDRLQKAVIASLLLAVSIASHAASKDSAWMTGVWTATSDEDGTPADVFEFRSDGKYVNYGISCAVNAVMPFHTYAGDIYVTSEIPGKGPISIVFRPSQDHRKLTYTSPRTRNNAVYERLQSNPCGKQG